MFHIVFDSTGAALLSAAMDLDDALDGETIVMEDDYSVGPLENLSGAEGRLARAAWWNAIRGEDPVLVRESSDHSRLQPILERMDQEEFDQIWIWIAPNSRDICGYFWLISQLDRFAGRVYIVHLHNLPFIGEKGNVFYPLALAEIPAREFVKARRLARPVTLAEFETDPDEWRKWVSANNNLRVLEGGKKIALYPDDYYDGTLLKMLQPAFQKIPRTVQQFLQKTPEKANESFLAWRLKRLVDSGLAEQQGESIRAAAKLEDTFRTQDNLPV